MSSRVPNTRIGFLVRLLFLLIMSRLCCVLCGSAMAGWTRDISRGGTMASYPGVPIVILLISSIDGRLSASCGYRYLDRIGPVQLHGDFDPDGQFSPLVKYEVPVGPNKWRAVAQSNKSAGPIAIRIDSVNSHAMLNIDMAPFRPMIGKYRWGRIVLENGETATLSLDDLLPTGDSPHGADYKTAVRDEDPGRFGSSLSLVAVTSLSGQLTGEFAFVGAENRRVAELVGSRDSKGDFLPSVTLQAGNSDQDWRTLEEARKVEDGATLRVSTENPAVTLRVNLDPYRQLVGRLKYGKIVFSNGEYSAFELDRLDSRCVSAPSKPE